MASHGDPPSVAPGYREGWAACAHWIAQELDADADKMTARRPRLRGRLVAQIAAAMLRVAARKARNAAGAGQRTPDGPGQ